MWNTLMSDDAGDGKMRFYTSPRDLRVGTFFYRRLCLRQGLLA